MKDKLKFELLLDLICEVCNIEKKELNKNTKILDIEEWDSMSNVRIFVAIEKKFNIKVKPEEIEDFKTIENFFNYLAKLKNEI
jgi:acyl carrier protein